MSISNIILIQRIYRGYIQRKKNKKNIKIGICEDCNKKNTLLMKVKACLDDNCCYKYICNNFNCNYYCHYCRNDILRDSIFRNSDYLGYIYPIVCNICNNKILTFKSWWGDYPKTGIVISI